MTANDGRVLLRSRSRRNPERRHAGFRVGARGTHLALALARSPRVPPGTPRIVLNHVPDVALKPRKRDRRRPRRPPHGGQIRLLLRPLTTRCALGPHYGRGLFYFRPRTPVTALYIGAGIGTSVLPVRFNCPPRWGLVELRP